MAELVAMPKYESYKESGFEWIGEVPESWELTKLGSCLSPVSIKNNPELPLLSITRELGVIERDVEDQDSNHNFIPDDLSGYKKLEKGQFGMNKMKAWQGSYGVSKYTGIVSPAYYVFNFTKVMSPEFFNWAIRSKLYVSYFGSASDGVRVGQWDLSKDRMKAIPFILPSEQEQAAIANFLDKKTAQIDEAIAIKEKQIELLKERKQIIIQQAVTQGISCEGQPKAAMKDSGVDWIGEIPEHWETKKLKFLSIYFKGFAFKSDDFVDEGIAIVKASNIKLHSVSNVQSFIANDNQRSEFERFRLKTGDVVISTVGSKPEVVNSSVGQLCSISHDHNNAYLNQNTVCIRPNKKLDKRFLKYVFASKYMRNEFDRKALWIANQAYLEIDEILDILVALPKDKEQIEIADYLDLQATKFAKAIEGQYSQIEKLKEYKITLINSAVTGKIKVPEVDSGC